MLNNFFKYIFIVLFVNSEFLLSCPVCFAYGSPDDSVIDGMNSAILFMLVIIFTILIAIGLFMYNMYKKESELS